MFQKEFIILFSLIIAIKSQSNPIQNDLISISNKLALNLLNTFPSDGNNFFSPLSITTALLMVMNGAKGVTNQEFRQLFNLDNSTNIDIINEDVKKALTTLHQKQNDKLTLKLANLLLVANGFPLNKEYRQIISQLYESRIDSVNFSNNSQQIVKDINEWVSKQTNGKIQSIFDEGENLPDDTPMVLLNAIYFKGMWKYVFDKRETRKEKFLNFGDINKATLVDMMISQRSLIVKHSNNLQANVFEMPFSSDMTMIVILPDELDGLDAVTKRLTLRTLNHTVFRLGRGKPLSERLMFPKFKLEQEYDLKGYLQNLGLKSLFEDNANLSGVNGANNLYVAKAIHKAFIEVNEEGAEAAAVTKVQYGLRSYRPPPAKVDRPFLFAIIDRKSSLIWFLGQIRKLS